MPEKRLQRTRDAYPAEVPAWLRPPNCAHYRVIWEPAYRGAVGICEGCGAVVRSDITWKDESGGRIKE